MTLWPGRVIDGSLRILVGLEYGSLTLARVMARFPTEARQPEGSG